MTRWSEGFTLLETVVALAILAIGTSAIMVIFADQSHTAEVTAIDRELDHELMDLLDQIAESPIAIPEVSDGWSADRVIHWQIRAAPSRSTADTSNGGRLQDVVLSVSWQGPGPKAERHVETRHYALSALR